MPGRSIGSVEVQVSGDFSPLRDQARGVFRGLGRQWESDLKGLGKEHAATYFDEFDKETDNRIKRTSKRTWGSFDDENDKNVATSAKKAATGFSNTFSGILGTQAKALAGRFSLILGGIAAVAEPAIAGIAGLAGAATALASSGIAAAVGALAPLPAILTGLGGFALAAAFGLKGMGTAIGDVSKALRDGDLDVAERLDAINEAVKTLGPNAAAFAKTFGALNVEFDNVRKAISDRIFAGLDTELGNLSRVVLPGLEDAFLKIAVVINEVFVDIARTIAASDIGDIFRDLIPAVKNVADAFVSLLGSFLQFIAESTPAATRLSELFLGWTTRLGEFLDKVTNDGSLATFLDGAIDSLQTWLDLLGSVGRFLAKVVSLGQGFGDELVKSLTKVVDGWTENEVAISKFFETGRVVIDALKPLFAGLGEGIRAIVTPDAIARFTELAASIGEILPVLGELIAAIGSLGILNTVVGAVALLAGGIERILPSLQPFVDLFADLSGELLAAAAPLLDSIADALIVLLDALTPLIEPLREVGTELFRVMAEQSIVLVEALIPIIEALEPLIELFVALLPAIVPIVTLFSGILTLQIKLVTALIEVMARTLVTLIDAFLAPIGGIDGLVEKLNGMADTFRTVKDTISSVVGLIVLAIDRALDGIRRNWDSAVTFIADLPDRFGDALSGLKDAITEPFRKAYDAAKGYVDKIKNLPGNIAGGVGNALLPGNPFANNARGTIVSQATKMIAGEAGAEAVIPLTRPLAQIDPSVRAMRAAIDAAMIGGQVRVSSPQSQSSGPGTVQNNTWNITESNNAEATAQKVLNRLAASF